MQHGSIRGPLDQVPSSATSRGKRRRIERVVNDGRRSRSSQTGCSDWFRYLRQAVLPQLELSPTFTRPRFPGFPAPSSHLPVGCIRQAGERVFGAGEGIIGSRALEVRTGLGDVGFGQLDAQVAAVEFLAHSQSGAAPAPTADPRMAPSIRRNSDGSLGGSPSLDGRRSIK